MNPDPEARRGSGSGGVYARRRWLGYLTAIALVYFAVHNILDFYANMPAVLFAVAVPIAYLDATAPGDPSVLAAVRRAIGSGRLAVRTAAGELAPHG